MTPWNETRAARTALALLHPSDLRIVAARDNLGNPVLAYAPATDNGRSVFAQLETLMRRDPVEKLFAAAQTDAARARVLDLAEQRPTVEGAVGQHFGSANRFLGLDPLDATRRFHANTQARSVAA